MAKSKASQEASTETGLAPKVEQNEPIQFKEPVSAADQVAVVADSPQEQAISEKSLDILRAAANNEDLKRDFTLKVLAARAKHDEAPAATPSLAPRVIDQTNAEMEAGRKMNEHHAALAVHRPAAPAPHPNEATTTSVFRPADYVPDQVKGQGYTQGRGL